MKTISSKSKVALLTAFTVVFATVPVSQSGAVQGESGNNNSTTCNRMSALSTTGRATVAAHAATMQSDFATRLLTMTSNKAAIDQKVLDARTAANIKFEEKIAELKSRDGLTQEQVTAINTYQVNMQTAEATRTEAVDIARTAYRTALSANVRIQQETLTAAVATYQTAVNAAFATATEDCTNGSANATLRATVKTARETLATVRQSTGTGDSIRELIIIRNEAVRAANEAFAASAETYTATLIAALNV
jgi:hypothetical protein